MKKFLIVKPSSLGDILHAFPALSLLAKAYPGSKADWLVHPAFAGLLGYHPDVGRAIEFRRKELGSLLSFVPSFLALLKELRLESYDAVFDLQGLMRSAAIARFARAPRLVGFSSPKERLSALLYSDRIEIPEGRRHAVERNCQLVSSFLGLDFSVPDIELPVNESLKLSAKGMIPSAYSGPESLLIGLAPGARWDTKRWPPSFFAKLADAISEARPEAVFLILGSAGDAPLAASIAAEAKTAKLVDLTGRSSIGQLVELARLCSLFISNDSGPMHVAAAVKTPLLALFGPTDPSLTGPHSKSRLVVQPDLDCIKCLKRYCQKGLCHGSLNPLETAAAAMDFMHWRKAL